MPYPQNGRSIKNLVSNNNDAASITNYGFLVRPYTQIIALCAHCTKAPLSRTPHILNKEGEPQSHRSKACMENQQQAKTLSEAWMIVRCSRSLLHIRARLSPSLIQTSVPRIDHTRFCMLSSVCGHVHALMQVPMVGGWLGAVGHHPWYQTIGTRLISRPQVHAPHPPCQGESAKEWTSVQRYKSREGISF